MAINYEHYRVFYFVATYGSFSKAAFALHQGQPSVTKIIASLESQLGCKLFVRSNRGVTLTPEGEQLYRRVEVAVEQLNNGEEVLRRHATLEEGTVSIATTEIALHGCTLPTLSRFKQDYPHVKVHLTSCRNEEALRAVKNGSADFALVTMNENTDSHFQFTALRLFQEVLCCRAGYRETTPLPESGTVFDYPFISLHQKTYHYQFMRDYFLKLGLQREPDIEVSTVNQILVLVKSGVGIGFLPDIFVKDALGNGEIEEIPIKLSPPIRHISLVEEHKHGHSLAADTFITYLKNSALQSNLSKNF